MVKLYGNKFEYTSLDTNENIDLLALPDKTLRIFKPTINGSLSINGSIQYIYTKDDFPTAISGIVYLEDFKKYIILGTVDMEGLVFVSGASTSLAGSNAQTSFLTSTGMSGTFITGTKTISFTDLTIKDISGTLFDLYDSTGLENLFWSRINFSNCPTFGTINNFANLSVYNSNWNTSGIIFDGSVGSISFTSTFLNNTYGTTMITIPATATVTRRFKIIESPLFVSSGGTMIDFSTSATIGPQGFILTSNNFAGTGTYLSGVQSNDDKALFFKNVGINNSRSVGSYRLSVGAVTTLVLNTWTKLACTTVIGTINQKFTSLTTNRTTYNGSLNQIFTITYTIAFTGSNNDIIEAGISLNGADPLEDTINLSTIDSGGAVSSTSLTTVISLDLNDYIEVWVRNTSGSRPITSVSLKCTAIGEF